MADWPEAARAQTPGPTRRLYVTGASGFVGQWVLRMADSLPGWTIVAGDSGIDLLDTDGLCEDIRACQPDGVLHLAAQSSVADSLTDPVGTARVNVLGTVSLLHALQREAFAGRLLFVSSSDVYGRMTDGDLHAPIPETRPTAPLSPYAASKLAGEIHCLQWARSRAAQVVIARSFSHLGPGQSTRFAMASFAAQISANRHAGRTRLLTGDIDVIRDYLDVRDVVRAYFALLTSGRPGQTYNVSSGKGHRLRELIVRMAQLQGADLELMTDPARLRPADIPALVGDNARLREDTGWSPALSMDQTLHDLLAHASAHSTEQPT